MKKYLIQMLLFAVLAILAGTATAGTTAAPKSTPELQKTIGTGKKNTIVFFQNPLGGPCRAQNEILQKLLKDRKNGFNLAAVSTMKQEDQRGFYDYGVRNLPTLVLVDRNGNINRFFPPGIQSYEALAAALDAVK
jgi:thioredoxin 1